MSIAQVKLRSGDVAVFNQSKIGYAIALACDATGRIDKDFIPSIVNEIIADMEVIVANDSEISIPTVEMIQDCVERHLMGRGYFEIAKV